LIIVKKVSSQDDSLNSVLPIKLFPKIKLNQEDDSTVLTFKSPVQSHPENFYYRIFFADDNEKGDQREKYFSPKISFVEGQMSQKLRVNIFNQVDDYLSLEKDKTLVYYRTNFQEKALFSTQNKELGMTIDTIDPMLGFMDSEFDTTFYPSGERNLNRNQVGFNLFQNIKMDIEAVENLIPFYNDNTIKMKNVDPNPFEIDSLVSQKCSISNDTNQIHYVLNFKSMV
jgi:hypothetical protein